MIKQVCLHAHHQRPLFFSRYGVLTNNRTIRTLFHRVSNPFLCNTCLREDHWLKQQQQQERCFATASSTEETNSQTHPKISEEELRKELAKYSETDVEKLEKMLEEIAISSQKEKREDNRPLMLFNTALLVILFVVLLSRFRDELSHEMTKELLIDTKEELGNEVLRLKHSRNELINKMLSTDNSICNAKCKEFVTKLKREMEEQDEQHINEIINQSILHSGSVKKETGNKASADNENIPSKLDNKSSRVV
jgi:predicted nucleic acid-binding Zn ribbon protein